MNPGSVRSIVTHRLRDATEVCLYALEKIGYVLDS